MFQKHDEIKHRKDRETERQRDREIERQRDRETERQRDRETHRPVTLARAFGLVSQGWGRVGAAGL